MYCIFMYVFRMLFSFQVIITAFTNDATKVRNARSAIFERQIRDTEKVSVTVFFNFQ